MLSDLRNNIVDSMNKVSDFLFKNKHFLGNGGWEGKRKCLEC